jgi:hypothetical protein
VLYSIFGTTCLESWPLYHVSLSPLAEKNEYDYPSMAMQPIHTTLHFSVFAVSCGSALDSSAKTLIDNTICIFYLLWQLIATVHFSISIATLKVVLIADPATISLGTAQYQSLKAHTTVEKLSSWISHYCRAL